MNSPALRPGSGEFSEQWASAERRYWMAYCRNAGECFYCGERGGKHEPGCKNEPEDEQEESSDEQEGQAG